MTDTLVPAQDSMPAAPPRPGAGVPSDYRFPHFSTRILANGLRLIVANVPAYPVVTTLAVSVPVIAGNIAGYGFGGLCAKVRASGLRVLEVDEGSPATIARLADEIAALGRCGGAVGPVPLGDDGEHAAAAQE